MRAKRKRIGGGRKPRLRKCAQCGCEMSAREMRDWHPFKGRCLGATPMPTPPSQTPTPASC